MLIDVLPSAAGGFSEVLVSGRCLIFLVCPTRDNLQLVIPEQKVRPRIAPRPYRSGEGVHPSSTSPA